MRFRIGSGGGLSLLAAGCVFAGAPTAAAAAAAAQERQFIDTLQLAALARDATRPFLDSENALMAGYRPVGPHSPGMGQHWVSVASLMLPVPDPARPALLTYLSVGDNKVLVGVAYATVADQGVIRENRIAPSSRWHVHSGNILDEGFFIAHDGAGHAHGATGVAVLHVWAWHANPDGLFASDNWALPYVAAGLDPGLYHSREASRALATAGDDGRFILEQMRRAVAMSPADERRIAAELARTGARSRAILPRPGASSPGRNFGEQLASEWRAVWQRLSRTLPQALMTDLAAQFGVVEPQRKSAGF